MAIRLTRMNDRYAGEAEGVTQIKWSSAGPLDPDEVLHELSKRGWDSEDIISALKAADAEWSKQVGGEVRSWGELSMQAAMQNQPIEGVTPVTPGWRWADIGFEGQPIDIGVGVDPWSEKWLSLYRSIVLAQPHYPWQRHTAVTYQVAGSDPPIVFAAGELSNGVWAFYLPIRPPRDIARR